MPAIGFTINDLDLQEVKHTNELAIRVDRVPADIDKTDVTDILSKLKLMDNGQINNAAVVLFGKDPFPKYPCTLRLARFRGVTEDEFIDNKIIYGNAFEFIKAV